MTEFIFNKIPRFQYIFLKTFRHMRLYDEKLLFEKHLILDVKTTLRLQKPHSENFWTLKIKVIGAV